MDVKKNINDKGQMTPERIAGIMARIEQVLGNVESSTTMTDEPRLRVMRILHGRAIVAVNMFINYLSKMGFFEEGKRSDRNSDNALLALSYYTSLLTLIHRNIRKYEKKVIPIITKDIKSNIRSEPSAISSASATSPWQPDTNIGTLSTTSPGMPVKKNVSTHVLRSASSKPTARVSPAKPGTQTEEISVRGLETTEQQPQKKSVSPWERRVPSPTKTINEQKQLTTSRTQGLRGGNNEDGCSLTESELATLSETANTSEIINNLETSDVERMLKTPARTASKRSASAATLTGGFGSFDINKPTIINYWASWCGYSNQFKPKWDKFESEAKTKFPQLQVLDLDVCNNPELSDLAKAVGVKGFPTVVVFHNNKISRMTSGDKKSEDIVAFVETALNK